MHLLVGSEDSMFGGSVCSDGTKKIDQNTPLGAQILRKLAKIMQVM